MLPVHATFAPVGHTLIFPWDKNVEWATTTKCSANLPPISAIVIPGNFTRILFCLNLPDKVISSPHSPLYHTDFSNTWK